MLSKSSRAGTPNELEGGVSGTGRQRQPGPKPAQLARVEHCHPVALPALSTGYVDSLLDLAGPIAALAPSAAGFARPNPEYPWRDPATGHAVAPPPASASHAFDPRDIRTVSLERLVGKLFQLAH
jgi:hypothetical protein